MPNLSINLLRQNYLLIFLRQNFGDYFIWARASTVGVTGRLAQLVERRTREHNVSCLYRCGSSPRLAN